MYIGMKIHMCIGMRIVKHVILVCVYRNEDTFSDIP